MVDALTQTESLARLDNGFDLANKDVLTIARLLSQDSFDLIPLNQTNIELGEEDLSTVERMSESIRSVFTPSSSAYTGEFSDGFFMKWDYSEDPIVEVIYKNLCRDIAKYIVINFKILGLDPEELSQRLSFEFIESGVIENYGNNEYKSLHFGGIEFRKDSLNLKFRISLLFFLLMKDLYRYIREATTTGEEFDDSRIKECSHAIDYLYKVMIKTIAHEAYHVAQKSLGIKYSDNSEDKSSAEMTTIGYLLSINEATAREYEDIAYNLIVKSEKR